MSEADFTLEEKTRLEIEKIVWDTLRDAGATQPPVRSEVLVEHLRMYRDFYDLRSPGFIDRAIYKSKVRFRRIVEAVRKSRLLAVLLYDQDRIVLDEGLPEKRREWPTFHELTHRIVPWHETYFLGDSKQTLDPDWHERLEAEANYGASALMFCGPVFTREALDTIPNWSSAKDLKERYGTSYHATLRRYVEHGPDHAMAGMVSTPWWLDNAKEQPKRWRHFFCSKKFAARFDAVTPDDLLNAVDANARKRRGGPVGDFRYVFEDDNCESHEFHGESFFNRYDILTLFVQVQKRTARRIVLPPGGRV